MPESLLSPSEIKLFGREFPDLKLNFGSRKASEGQRAKIKAAQNRLGEIDAMLNNVCADLGLTDNAKSEFINNIKSDFRQQIYDRYLGDIDKEAESRLGSNNFLLEQLLTAGARLARIYAFAYEGDTYFLPKPYVFLVHGPGKLVIEPNRYDALANAEVGTAGITVDRWGVVAKIERFADDVFVWDYDKEDFSLRIDIVSGPLSEIALEPAMAGDSSTSRADMTSRANMALRANMAGSGGGSTDMAARANLAVRHRFTR